MYYGAGHSALGLIRIVGSMNSSKVIELVVNKLNQFGLELNKGADAASLLVKFGKETSPIHLQRLSHGPHLVVFSVLYNSYYQNL